MHKLTRTGLLAAGAGLALAPSALAQRKRGDGFKSIPYLPQDALPYYKPGIELDRNWGDIDPLMREGIRQINRSGWVWTAESCQGGHRFSETPMLRLVCRTADLSDLLMAIFETQRQGTGSDTRIDDNVTIERHAPAPKGWTEFRVYNQSNYSQLRSIAFFNRLSNAL